MDLAEIIAEARRRTDDAVAPYQVSDASHIARANEAEREASFRARLLFDESVRPGITTFEVQADQNTLPIHPSVFWIDCATFKRDAGGRACGLEATGLDWMRRKRGGQWDCASRPTAFADNGNDGLRLWPTPSMPGTLQLAVYRYPLFPMEDLNDEPEVREEHHEGLVDWLVYRLYSDKDSELYDEAKAGIAYSAFERRFGPRPHSADVMRRHRERRAITTRYGGL